MLNGPWTKEEFCKPQARVLESMAEGVSICDKQGIICFANPALDEMFGYLRWELVGQHVTVLNKSTPEQNLLIFRQVSKCLEKEGRWAGEFENRRKDGSVLYTHARISTLELSGKKYWITVHEDVTDQKQCAERIETLNSHLSKRREELESANKKLKEANVKLEAFNYMVSHDLRSPLTNIHLYAETILDLFELKLEKQCKEMLAGIIHNVERMDDIISTLLQFSLISGRDLKKEAFDIGRLAKEIAAGLLLKYPDRKVVFEAEDEIEVEGDEHLLRIVLKNIFENAWKFTKKKKKAVIKFGRVEVERKPVYYLRDNGVGFDMALADKLFETFHSLHDRKEFEGYGIGLSTVKGAIEKHGGKIWAEGKVGSGATFFFTLD